MVGSPEVEGFRELKHQRRETSVLEVGIPIGADWKRNEESEHHDVDKLADVRLRSADEQIRRDSALVLAGVVLNGKRDLKHPADENGEQLSSDFVLELGGAAAKTEGEEEVESGGNLKEKGGQVQSTADYEEGVE